MGSFLCSGSKGQVAKITLKMKLTNTLCETSGGGKANDSAKITQLLLRKASTSNGGGGVRGLLSKPQSANGTHIAFER